MKKKPILPGANVGGRTSKDDGVPKQQHKRDMTIRTAKRGRTEPRRAATPPKKR